MKTFTAPALTGRVSPAFLLLTILLCVLWLAGGASRADVAGQPIVRSAAWIAIVLMILCGSKPQWRSGWAMPLLLLSMLLLVCAQLIPLPPVIWQSLPGRSLFADAGILAGSAQPWRPLSIVPTATLNAAASLAIPFAVLFLLNGLSISEQNHLPGFILGLITAAMLIGLIQFSEGGLENPLINGTAGNVGGNFANRNHFALFLAMGCLIAPAWAFSGRQGPTWRTPVALALVTLFVLTILATGSRSGILTGLIALAIGLAFSWHDIRHQLRHAPRWVFPLLITSLIGIVAVFVLISIAADRAESISRALEIDPGQDMRARGRPTVLAMIGAYFPAGSGFGGFDPIFRIHEPFGLLKPTYFNHAHNDYLEIVLDGGLPALILLMAATGWFIWASVRAWGAKTAQSAMPKIGSGLLLLVYVSSIFDYPARTPMIMAMIVIAGVWLSKRRNTYDGPTLPN